MNESADLKDSHERDGMNNQVDIAGAAALYRQALQHSTLPKSRIALKWQRQMQASEERKDLASLVRSGIISTSGESGTKLQAHIESILRSVVCSSAWSSTLILVRCLDTHENSQQAELDVSRPPSEVHAQDV